VKEKGKQRSPFSVTEISDKSSSTLDYLLSKHNLPHDFPLEQQIKEFEEFFKKPAIAHLNLDGRLEAFAKEKKWTDDERKNFKIMSAIKDGRSLIFGRMAKEHLIARKDETGGDWVYKYECCNCGSVDERGIKRALSQPQYDRLPEDEALQTLLGSKEIKMCRNCGENALFKRVKPRTNSWEREKFRRKSERIEKRKPIEGIPLTHEQVGDLDKALHEIQEKVVKKGNELIRDRIPTEREIRNFRLYARPFMKRYYEAVGGKLCARPDCLEPLPHGSRISRKYCSEECKAIEKSRRARKK